MPSAPSRARAQRNGRRKTNNMVGQKPEGLKIKILPACRLVRKTLADLAARKTLADLAG